MPLGFSTEIPAQEEIDNTSITRNDRSVKPLSETEYNQIMMPEIKKVDIKNANDEIPQGIEVNPETSVMYDLDTVNVQDENGTSTTYRLNGLLASESVDKENELFSKLKKTKDPIARASVAEEIKQYGVEKSSIDSTLKNKLDDFRQDWDITGVVPSASGDTGKFGRKLADDVIMKNKTTGEYSTLKYLASESGYATASEFDTPNEGSHLRRLQKQTDESKAEYFQSEELRNKYLVELNKNKNVASTALENVKKKVYDGIDSGQVSKEDGTNFVASLEKSHKLKFGSYRKEAKAKVSNHIKSLVSSNAGAEKVMTTFIEASRANVNLKMDEDTYKYLKDSVYDKDGTYKKKYKTEDARVKYRESVNAIITEFAPKNAKKKFAPISPNKTHLLTTTDGLNDVAKESINNRVHWFTGTDVDSKTETTLADINDFSTKYNLNPKKLVKAMTLIDADAEQVLSSINKQRKKLGLSEMSGMLSTDETLVKDGYSETIRFLENEDTSALSKRQRNAHKSMLKGLKEDVKYVNYAQTFDHDVLKSSVGLFDKTVMRNAIKFGNVVKDFVGEEATPMTPFEVPKKELNKLIKNNEIAPYETGFIDTTLNTAGSIATFVQSPMSKAIVDGLIGAFSDEKQGLQGIVKDRLDKAKVTGTSWGGVASELGTGAGKFVTVAKGVSEYLAKKGVTNKYVIGGSIGAADVASDAVLGTYSSDSGVRTENGFLNPLARLQHTNTSELITGASLNVMLGAGISKATNLMKSKVSGSKKSSQERTDEDYENYFQNIFDDNQNNPSFGKKFDEARDSMHEKHGTRTLDGEELDSAEAIIDNEALAVAMKEQLLDTKKNIITREELIANRTTSGEDVAKLENGLAILKDQYDSKTLVLGSVLDTLNDLHDSHSAKGYKHVDAYTTKTSGKDKDTRGTTKYNVNDTQAKEDNVNDTQSTDSLAESSVERDIQSIVSSVKEAKLNKMYQDKSEEDIDGEIQNTLSGKQVDVSLNKNESISSASIVDKFMSLVAPASKKMNEKEISFLDNASVLGDVRKPKTRDGGEYNAYAILDKNGNPVTDKHSAQKILHELFSYNEKANGGKFDDIFIGKQSSLLKPVLDKQSGTYDVHSYLNRDFVDGEPLRNTAVQHIITQALKVPDVSVHILNSIMEKDDGFSKFIKTQGYAKEDGTWSISRATKNSNTLLARQNDIVFMDKSGEERNIYNVIAEYYKDSKSYETSGKIIDALGLNDRHAVNSSATNSEVNADRLARVSEHKDLLNKIETLKNEHLIDFKNPAHYLDEVIDYYNVKAGTPKYKKYGDDSVSMYTNGPRRSGYGEFDAPLSILNFVKEMEGISNNTEATKKLYDILGVENSNLATAISKTGEVTPKQKYVPKASREPETHYEVNTKFDDVTEDVPVAKVLVGKYVTLRKLHGSIGDITTTSLIESFIDRETIKPSKHAYGGDQLSFYNNKGKYIFGRRVLEQGAPHRFNTASIGDGDGHKYANLKNYDEGAADISVIAESMPDAIAYLQAKSIDGSIKVDANTKIQIIDMDGLPTSSKVNGIEDDVAGSGYVIYAKDKVMNETKSQKSDIASFEKSDFINRTEAPKNHKDWNEYISKHDKSVVTQKQTKTLLDKVKKLVDGRINDDIDPIDTKIHRTFIDNALSEIDGLYNAFRKNNTGEIPELAKTSDVPLYSVKSGKIRLPNTTKIQNVSHEIIHAIQEKTILSQEKTDIPNESQIISKDMRDLVTDITSIGGKGKLPKSIQYKFDEFAQAYDNPKTKNENATRELLVHMFEDGEFANEMYSHRVSTKDGKKVIEKIDGTISDKDKIDVNDNVFVRILDGITSVLETIKSLGANIHKDSLGARVVTALGSHDELVTLSPSISNPRPQNILYATTQKNIQKSLLGGIKKRIFEGAHGDDNKALLDGLLALYDWTDKKFFSGEMSNLVRKATKYTTSSYDTNAKLDEISKMNEQASSKAKVKANAFIESVKALDFELTEKERMGSLALIRYDIASLPAGDIAESIHALANGKLEYFSNKYTEAKDNIAKIGEILREDNPLSETMFNADIKRLSMFVIQNKFSTNTKINSIDIVNTAFKDYGLDKSQIQALASHVDSFITMQALSNKQIFNKMHDRLQVSDAKQLENISQMFTMYKSSTEGFEAIGRKGDIIDNTLTESTLIAVPKEFVDGLSTNEKKIFKKRNTFDGGDGWYYIKETDASIQTQESVIKEPSMRDDIDAKIEGLEKEDLDLFTDAYKNGKLDDAINSHYDYMQNKGENVYAVIKGEKVVALRRSAPIQKLITEQSSPENILYNLVFSKDTKMHASLIHEYALEKMDIVSSKFATPVAEKNYIDSLKKSIQEDATEVADNLLFINPSVFKYLDSKDKAVFSSPSFKEKYKRISSEDRKYLPPVFSGEKYVRADMYDDLITQPLDMGIKAIHTSSLVRKALNHISSTVGLFKYAVVAANPDSFMNNIAFNSVITSMYMGSDFSPKKIAKDTGLLIEYQKLVMDAQKAKISGDKNYKQLQKKVDEHRMSKYDNLGMFSSMVDGIETTGGKEQHKFYNFVVDTFTSNVPKKYHPKGFASNVIRNMFFAEGSKSNKIAGNSVRFGDFVFRISLYDHLLEKYQTEKFGKMSKDDAHKKALETAMEQFVVSRKNTNKYVASADVYGIAMFARWRAKYFPAGYKALRDNPAKAIMIGTAIALYENDNNNATFKASSIYPLATMFDDVSSISEAKIPNLFSSAGEAIDSN